jgi:hypothetical protein
MSGAGRVGRYLPGTYSSQLHDKSWFRVCLTPSRSAWSSQRAPRNAGLFGLGLNVNRRDLAVSKQAARPPFSPLPRRWRELPSS